MKSQRLFNGCLLAAVMAMGSSFESAKLFAAPQDQAELVEGVEVLTRGPVHEAFAGTVTFDSEPGMVVSKTPPEPIAEVPPNQKPAGDNVAWIPGYWAWDEDRTDFLWISGIWRSLPPGRQWVPGYWTQVDQGSQWTSGYWADSQLAEVQYLPEPPATAETGPIGTAPSANHIWIPGSWVWNQNSYGWQPGYWSAAQQNWVWTPAYTQWTPRGYISVGGYYDYSVARRGVLFAPVYMNSSVYSQQGFTYSPAMAISMAVFGNQLFLRPSYGHYYFGDYYGSNYSGAGYQPWFAFNSGRLGYDPFYAQQAWQNRQNPAWAKTVQSDYQNRVDHEGARPPRTLADQQTLIKSGTLTDKNVATVTSLDQMAKSKDSSLKLEPVTKAEQQSLAKHGQAVQDFRGERQKLEAKGAVTGKAGKESAAVKLPKSPVVANSSDKLGTEHTPPKTHDIPKSDPKVEPKPREAAAKVVPPKTAPVKAAKPVLPEGKPATTAEPKVKPTVTPKTEKPPETPRPTPRTEPKVEPKGVPKVEPKAEPKPGPKAEPKPVPRPEPRPIAPKAEPKAEPRPAPKIETKPAPKPDAPKPQPTEKPKK